MVPRTRTAAPEPEHVLGWRVRLEFGEHEDDFVLTRPWTGTFARTLTIRDWGEQWLVMELDQPIRFHGHIHHHALLRERWPGDVMSASSSTPVIVLLILDPGALLNPAPASSAFYHLAWGHARLVPRDTDGEAPSRAFDAPAGWREAGSWRPSAESTPAGVVD